ncbi:amidase [Mesobaculum littorinae]|uniref:Amidase n=2 Tax=Mesobaculum littorinae TaxID=2486419 RepID=A0A438ADF0_9RHOB|nr:amidase [Mesobaculum littorinae]
MSAAELGRGIAAGKISPVALTETFLDAILRHPHAERIYARLTPDRARAEAAGAEARARAGLRRSPLDGVPVSWKDLFDTAGVATESGSALLRDRVPARDARVLANATAAGLVCLGKTHQTELAFSGLGLNPVTASPPNVFDTECVSGGSSSGAATSVAFGLAAAAVGSDTGGSVRVPAAWNGLVGLKTSAGRLSCEGVVPLAPRFDTVGPLTRTVEDAGLMLAVLEGAQPSDLRSAKLAGRRLAVLDTLAMDDIEDAPRAAFEAAVDRLHEAGAQVTRLSLPAVAAANALSPKLFAPEGYGVWGALIEADPEVMFPPVRERFRGGATVTAAEYVAAWRQLDALKADYAAATAGVDAVLIPTAPILPPKAAALEVDEEFARANMMTLRNTRIGNLMGLAVITLPTGRDACGISLMGPPRSEPRLLRLAAAVERALA